MWGVDRAAESEESQFVSLNTSVSELEPEETGL